MKGPGSVNKEGLDGNRCLGSYQLGCYGMGGCALSSFLVLESRTLEEVCPKGTLLRLR